MPAVHGPKESDRRKHERLMMKKTTVIQRFSLLCFVALIIFAIILRKYEHQFKKRLESYVPIRFDIAGGIDTVVEIYRNTEMEFEPAGVVLAGFERNLESELTERSRDHGRCLGKL